MLRLLAKMAWLADPKKVEYLTPLVQQGREETFTIATLNYDNAVELACKPMAVPISSGLEHWLQYGEFRNPEKGIELLKLHGSID